VTVHVGTGSGNVHAHDRSTGDERWAFEADVDGDGGAPLVSPPAAGAGSEQTVYAEANRRYVYSIDVETGEERWRVDVGGGTIRPQFVDGMLRVGGDDGLFAIETEPSP
jgi:outer membrane protein assembly factor BamB